MARIRRVELFHPREVAVVHVMSRVVRRCFLMGDDPVSGKNYDHRKQWIEQLIERFAANFGIDLIAFSLLGNHMHLVLRSRPDVVQTWEDREVARRWLQICPPRKAGKPRECTEADLNSICSDEDRLNEIRLRLSDFSWWMRLLCQRISIRANAEEQKEGRFWEGRFKSVRLLDEEAILACAAYVDLNPVRAALAETVEQSDYTSAQRRAHSFQQRSAGESASEEVKIVCRDDLLSPVQIEESDAKPGPAPSHKSTRCSDKGFSSLTEADYLQLLDWTARQIHPSKRGFTDATTPAIFDRLKIEPEIWCTLVTGFSTLFSLVAGQPERVDEFRTETRRQRFNLKSETRELLA